MEWRFTLNSTAYGSLVVEEPIGWSDIAITIKRDMPSHGVFFDYAVSLKFIESGRLYLKNAYEAGGIDQYIELLVEVKQSQTDAFEEFYKGKMLLAKLVFDCSDTCFVDCPIEPAGCLMKFKNRIDQKVDLQLCEDYDKNALPCYNFLPYKIKMKPKLVRRQSLGVLATQSNCYVPPSFLIPKDLAGGNHIVYETVYFTPKIQNFSIQEVQFTNLTNGNYHGSPAAVDVFLKAEKAGSYKIDLKFYMAHRATLYSSNKDTVCLGSGNNVAEWSCDGTTFTCGGEEHTAPYPYEGFSEYKVSFVIDINGSVHYQDFLIISNSCTDYNSSLVTDCRQYIETLNLNENDQVRVYYKVELGASLKRRFIDDGCGQWYSTFGIGDNPPGCTDVHMNVISETLEPPTDSKVYMINEAFSRVVENVTNDCMRVKSDYFGRTDSQPYTSAQDGCGSLESITVGKHLRQFPDNLCLMNPSFKDLFESMNAIHNIGYGIEPDANRPGYEWLRIEPMSYWYNNTVLMTCDNIPELRRKVMAEWYISLFEFGFEKWEAEQTSGLDEFAVKKQYRTTFSEIKSNLEKRCKFIGSGYSIENTRAEKYIDDSTKDWRWDNDIFVICVRRDGTATAPYSLISVEQGIDCINVGTATNIVDPGTIYNARISPNRNLLRWLPYLMANYAHDINNPLSYFRFVDGQGNYLAEMELINGCLYEKSGVNLAENQDIDSGDTNNLAQAKPIFKFELIDYDYPMSYTEFKTIRANPRGVVEYRGTDMPALKKGFIYNIQYKPNTGIATFTLLPKYEL